MLNRWNFLKTGFYEGIKVDLVHVHFPLPLGMAGAIAARLRHKPLVVTVHGNADIYEGGPRWYPVVRRILQMADHVTTVGEELATVLRKEIRVTKPLTVTPTGVNTDDYVPATKPEDGPVSLVSIGRLMLRKNLAVLVRAVQQLHDAGVPVELVIAGTGPEEDKLRAMAAERTAPIRFEGFVSEERKIGLLQQADLFVQPSLSEGLSRSTVEAFACGTAALVSDAIGVREPVTVGKTGFLISDCTSVASVASAIVSACGDRARLRAMGWEARQEAVARFSSAAMAKQYLGIYSRLASPHLKEAF